MLEEDPGEGAGRDGGGVGLEGAAHHGITYARRHVARAGPSQQNIPIPGRGSCHLVEQDRRATSDDLLNSESGSAPVSDPVPRILDARRETPS